MFINFIFLFGELTESITLIPVKTLQPNNNGNEHFNTKKNHKKPDTDETTHPLSTPAS